MGVMRDFYRAKPKSQSLTAPPAPTSTFCGFMSAHGEGITGDASNCLLAHMTARRRRRRHTAARGDMQGNGGWERTAVDDPVMVQVVQRPDQLLGDALDRRLGQALVVLCRADGPSRAVNPRAKDSTRDSQRGVGVLRLCRTLREQHGALDGMEAET